MRRSVYYSVLMAAVAAVSVSCQSIDDDQKIKGSYDYVFAIAEDGTRAMIDDDVVKYEMYDELGVYAGGTANAETAIDVSTLPVQFKVSTADALVAGDDIYAYFPYSSANASKEASAVTLTIPTDQRNPKLAMPMVSVPYEMQGTGAGSEEIVGNIKFLNLAGYIQFNIYGADYTDEKVESVKFESASALAGSFTFDLTGVSESDLSTLAISGYDKTAVTSKLETSVNVPATKAGAVPVYMAVAPGIYYGTITVYTDRASYVFDVPEASAKEISRARIKPLNANLTSDKRTAYDISDTDVATVDHVGYATLAEAVTAVNSASSACELKLLQDVELDAIQTINYNSGRLVTIDLNGHKISGNVATSTTGGNYTAMIIAKCNIIFKDTVGGGEITNEGGRVIYINGAAAGKDIEAVFDGGIFTAVGTNQAIMAAGTNATTGRAKIYINEGAKVSAVDGNAIILGGYGINNSAIAYISGGEIKTSGTASTLKLNANGAEAHICGGHLTSGNYAVETTTASNRSTGLVIDIYEEAGIQAPEFASTNKTIYNNYGTTTVSGGRFSADGTTANFHKNTNLEVSGGYFTSNTNVSCASGFSCVSTDELEGYSYKVVDGRVAMFNGVKYTLEEAISNAESTDDAVIMMISDYNANSPIAFSTGSITLDLNGHNISCSGTGSFSVNGCYLTIDDTNPDAEGELSCAVNSLTVASGTLHIHGGVITSPDTKVVVTKGSSKLIVDGGTITNGNTDYVINITESSSAEFFDGANVESTTASARLIQANGNASPNNPIMTFYGGNFMTNGSYCIAASSNSICNIEGGSFSGKSRAVTSFANSAKVNISDGWFTGEVRPNTNNTTYKSNFVISGGHFTMKPTNFTYGGGMSAIAEDGTAPYIYYLVSANPPATSAVAPWVNGSAAQSELK